MGDSETTALSESDRFFKNFQEERIDLEAKINALGTISTAGGERNYAIEHCQAVIVKLSSEVYKASPNLAAHDRRTYDETIKALQLKLQKTKDTLSTKKKFAFRTGPSNRTRANDNAANGESPTTTSAQAGPSEPQPTNNEPATNIPHKPSDEVPSASFSQSKALDLDEHYRQHIHLPSPPTTAPGAGNISNIHRCVIDRRRADAGLTPLASLTIKAVRESLIICSRVDGPVHLTDITDSIVVVASRQFRMHESRNCDVYLHVSSRPIVERCAGIRFAPLPGIYCVEEGEGEGGQWAQVDDFDWHRPGPSPNWRVLGVGERVGEEVWRDVVPGRPLKGVEDILGAVNVLK